MLIDPLYSLSGFVVGLVVGMTGVGGGSLMTPLLILFFGIHPATAVGTDLLYAAATKSCDSVVHGFGRSIEWRIVRRLATGSVPAAIATLTILPSMDLESPGARSLITLVLCGALLLTAGSLIFRSAIVRFNRRRFRPIEDWKTTVITVVLGAVLGVLVTTSSVGAGAVRVVALITLYPALPMKRIVASDITHAVPLTPIAGAGHWVIGTVDWHIIRSLLAGHCGRELFRAAYPRTGAAAFVSYDSDHCVRQTCLRSYGSSRNVSYGLQRPRSAVKLPDRRNHGAAMAFRKALRQFVEHG